MKSFCVFFVFLLHFGSISLLVLLMSRQMLKFVGKVFDRVVDRIHHHHDAELERLTSRVVALARFPGQAPLAAGDLRQAAALLRAERLRQHRSLQEFLAATGMTRSTLNRIENQKLSPSIATLERIAAALGMKLLVALVEKDEATTSESCNNDLTGAIDDKP